MKQAGPWQYLFNAIKRTEGGLVVATIVVVVLTTWLDPRHTYWRVPLDSAETIPRNAVMLGIFALGSAIVIIAGGIDLSAGSMIAFGATTCADDHARARPQGDCRQRRERGGHLLRHRWARFSSAFSWAACTRG